MSDDLTKRGPADARRISLKEPWEVRYACKDFGCTEERLTEAVAEAGDDREAVRAWLADHPPGE